VANISGKAEKIGAIHIVPPDHVPVLIILFLVFVNSLGRHGDESGLARLEERQIARGLRPLSALSAEIIFIFSRANSMVYLRIQDSVFRRGCV
jgi:hypothetical protein